MFINEIKKSGGKELKKIGDIRLAQDATSATFNVAAVYEGYSSLKINDFIQPISYAGQYYLTSALKYMTNFRNTYNEVTGIYTISWDNAGANSNRIELVLGVFIYV